MTDVVAELDPADWHRLNRLLEQALSFDAGEREAWLRTLADEVRELEPVLRRLLEDHERDRKNPPAARTGTGRAEILSANAPVPDQPGDCIGPYRLLRLLGQGGMANVWLAERADGTMQRQVALKIPHAEWADRGLVDRISRECAVLESLNHPNIALLYDAGWSETGRPFLALEAVEGEHIDRSCRNRGLDVRARVRLFIDVLRAVAYAHARLVVHRDLKPANVLVTSEGRVKLLDFGIAKVLARESHAVEETELTRFAGRPLTFAYAAPEQFLGEAVTTATDIYALGVMLFELIGGERPYRPQDDSRTAFEEAIARSDPPMPSSRAKEKSTARALRGDLDAIVLKAMHRNPEDRYETAAAFADDLERYLDGRAVYARRISRWYRTQRFLARNRLAALATAAVAAALVAGLTVALWQARRAEAAAHDAQLVNNFMLSLIQQADPDASRTTRASDRALLKTFEDRIERELADRPDLQLPLRLALATAYRNRDENADARQLLHRAIAQAEGRYPPDDLDLLRAHVLLGEVSTDDSEVAAALNPTIVTLRALGPPGVPLLADALTARSESGRLGDPLRLTADAREAYDVARTQLGLDNEHTLRAANHLATLLGPGVLNRNREALEVLEPVVRAVRASHRLPATHPLAVRALALYGQVLCWLDRADEGIPLLEENVRIAVRQHEDGVPAQNALVMLASGQLAAGQGEQAIATYATLYTLAAQKEAYGGRSRYRVGSNLSFALVQANRPLDAEPFIDEGDAFRKSLAPGEASLAADADVRIVSRRVGSLLGLGEYERARQVGTALRKRLLHGKSEDYYVRLVDFYLGDALVATGHLQEADQVAQEALRIERLTDEAGNDLRWILACPARVKLALGHPAEALALTDLAGPEQANHPLQGSAASQNSDLAEFFLVRGRALIALNRARDALEPLRWAHSIWSAIAPRNAHAHVAAYWYAHALDASGDHARAQEIYDLRQAAPPDFPPPDTALLARERARPGPNRIEAVLARYEIRPEIAALLAAQAAAGKSEPPR